MNKKERDIKRLMDTRHVFKNKIREFRKMICDKLEENGIDSDQEFLSDGSLRSPLDSLNLSDNVKLEIEIFFEEIDSYGSGIKKIEKQLAASRQKEEGL